MLIICFNLNTTGNATRCDKGFELHSASSTEDTPEADTSEFLEKFEDNNNK